MDYAAIPTIRHEYWIDFMVMKVTDPIRREHLFQLFSGREGINKFYNMMYSRKGAIEFKNGTWKPTVREYKNYEKFKRRCIGCGFNRPYFSPWKEIFVELIPKLCPYCEDIIVKTENNQIQNMSNETTESIIKAIQDFQKTLGEKKQSIIASLQKQMGEVNIIIKTLTGEHLNHDIRDINGLPEFVELRGLIAIRVPTGVTGRRGRPAGSVNKTTDKPKKDGRKKRGPMSAAHKAKLKAAARARWAKVKKNK